MDKARLIILILISIIVLGCSHRKNVICRAAFEFDCPESSVKVTKKENKPTQNHWAGILFWGERYLHAEGCGKSALYICKIGKWISNCRAENPPHSDEKVLSGATSRSSATKNAARDLSCEEGRLDVVKLQDHVYGVAGCGKRVIYRCKSQYWKYWCSRETNVLDY